MKRTYLLLFSLALCLYAPQALAFTDVGLQDDEDAIDYLFDEDIVDGYSDGSYRPRNPINRAELLKILVESRVSHISSDEDCFSDVKDEWFAPYVCYAKEEGWVQGYSDGTFKPGNNINRAEAIAMTFKVYADELDFLDIEDGEDAVYLDVSNEAWYADYLYTGKKTGVLAKNTYFYPGNEITRGDTASLLYRLLSSLEEVEDEPVDDEGSEVASPAPVSEGPEIPEEPVTVEISSEQNPFSGVTLYIDPYSDAAEVGIEEIASQPMAKWFGDWNSDIEVSADEYVSKVAASGALPVMVIYNIPGRDCGSYSAGGTSDAEEYLDWIQSFADGVGSREAVVILEPDALPLDCLHASSESLMADAVDILKSKPGIAVYLDAGHPNWTPADEMAERLKAANIEAADGFSLNVSNFYSTAENIAYGEELSALVGAKHFIIDTGRNGNGWNGEWCNPSDMSLGQNPTVDTGEELVDAYLWVKPPGESDGTCNGGPSAGGWWLEYALGLAGN